MMALAFGVIFCKCGTSDRKRKTVCLVVCGSRLADLFILFLSRCENFPPGQCWLAYPICPNRRNLLRAKADNELQEADNELYEDEPGNGVEIIFDTRSGRSLSDGEYIDMLLDQCNKEIDAAIAWLQGGVEGISSPCNSLLQEHVDFACFKLPN